MYLFQEAADEKEAESDGCYEDDSLGSKGYGVKPLPAFRQDCKCVGE